MTEEFIVTEENIKPMIKGLILQFMRDLGIESKKEQKKTFEEFIHYWVEENVGVNHG